jgi:hypothetical protein
MAEVDKYYLVFVDIVGHNVDGSLVYEFCFSQSPEVVWGENWNATPASIVPQIRPDEQTIDLKARMITKEKFLLAKENTCFSMQDCIDGIIPLLFTDPHDRDTLILRFGMEQEDVEDALSGIGLELVDYIKTKEAQDNDIINGLINDLEKQMEDEGGDEDE